MGTEGKEGQKGERGREAWSQIAIPLEEVYSAAFQRVDGSFIDYKHSHWILT